MAKKLLTNCPNCGAPLRRDGTCEYCGTKARYTNEIDISVLKNWPSPIELELQIKNEDTIIILPMKGIIDTISLESSDTCYVDHFNRHLATVCNATNVEFTFNGQIIDNR